MASLIIFDLPQNIQDKIMPEPMSGCWLWTASRSPQGYGHLSFRGKYFLAHRLVYTLLRNPIRKGGISDHLCRNRACVNPSHIEIVTHQINLLRGNTTTARHAAKTCCPKGHMYDAIDSHGGRRCSICRAENQRNYKIRKTKKVYSETSIS